MNAFEYVQVKTITQALAALREGGEGAVAKAGGVDLLDQMKEQVAAPRRLVNLAGIGELRGLKASGAGLRIGPMTTLAKVADDREVKARYAAIAQAAGSAANPQIRNLATVGGNLCQRPRCWYFRAAEFPCMKKGGSTCFAKEGENKYHSIFGGGPSYIVHPSTMATALVAFGGSVRIASPDGKERDVELDKFFVLPSDDYERENVLKPGELITDIQVPAPAEGARSVYAVAKEKQVYDWPLAEVVVVLAMRGGAAGGTIERASIVLGAAAPIPWRAKAAEAALSGKRISAEIARAAGRAAVQGAEPMRDNGYKVKLFETLVARAVMQAAQGPAQGG